MDTVPNNDSLNSRYPPVSNGSLTSPYVSNDNDPSQASEYAEDGTCMTHIQDTTTDASVPQHSIRADGYRHKNPNQSPYQSMIINDYYAAAGPSRVGTGDFSQASQYSNIDPVLLRQSRTTDGQCHDHASKSNISSNTYATPAGQSIPDNTPPQHWAYPSYYVGGFGHPANNLQMAQLPEEQRDGLQTYPYDIRYSQTHQIQQQPTDPSPGGLANAGNISARPPADPATLSGAPAASIGASGLVLHGGVSNVDQSGASPEPPTVRVRRLSTWGRYVGRPLPAKLQAFLFRFGTLTMDGARPSRTQLKDENFREHFTSNGRLRRYSTLMHYYGDTRIFPLALWRYLADYVEEDG